MNKQEIKDIEHFTYPIPFNSELKELDLVPYRTNSSLHRKIDYIFRHVTFEHRKLFINVSTSGSRQLVNDMSTKAVSMVRHFMQYPQQYGHKMDNIHMQILVRMWRQTFRHCVMQELKLDKYYSTKMILLMIENGLIEELIRTVDDKDYIQHNDDMITKVRYNEDGTKLGLRERKLQTQEGSKNFEYLCTLE